MLIVGNYPADYTCSRVGFLAKLFVVPEWAAAAIPLMCIITEPTDLIPVQVGL